MLQHVALALAAFQAVYAEPLLMKRQSNCSDLELVIARGTSEPNAPHGGKYGVIVGDPLFNATSQLIPGATGYAVSYPASSACNSRPLGVADTISHLTSASAACPAQKFAVVGYSQGAAVVNQALAELDPSLYSSIIAIIQFGDPANKNVPNAGLPVALAQKRKENCAFGDPVCSNNGSDFTKHLTYNGATFIDSSASYIQKQLQSDGQTGPDDTDDTPPGSQTSGNTEALLSLRGYLGQNTSSTTSACPTSTGMSAGATNMANGTAAGTVTASTTGGSSTTSTAPASYTGGASAGSDLLGMGALIGSAFAMLFSIL